MGKLFKPDRKHLCEQGKNELLYVKWITKTIEQYILKDLHKIFKQSSNLLEQRI